jgi:selenocysteine-specific translation elongation factor
LTASVTVAVVGDPEIGPAMGKKGTQSDLALFNHVREGHAATIVQPLQYPEKFPPLLFAVAMADRVVFAVSQLDRAFAEAAATLEHVDTPVDIRLGPGAGQDEVRRALKGSALEGHRMETLDVLRLREEVDGWSSSGRTGPVCVPIDHAFAVKGVGPVALGVVRQGTLRIHERLRLFPSEKEVEVRSIQVHDADVPEAQAGERVGVALKGVDADELARGQILALRGELQVASSLTGRNLSRCRYYRGDLRVGAQLHLQVGMQMVPVLVDQVSESAVGVTADRPVAWESGQRAILADLSPPVGPRIVGGVDLGSGAQSK